MYRTFGQTRPANVLPARGARIDRAPEYRDEAITARFQSAEGTVDELASVSQRSARLGELLKISSYLADSSWWPGAPRPTVSLEPSGPTVPRYLHAATDRSGAPTTQRE